ncbi:small integral membrane protein 27 [Ambystoma mexicanum]|uniref:small integral membrane protein 27 n=1 Tax=Ambystoma mexicanum TaxID=8296 RepID=UPI0037E9C053
MATPPPMVSVQSALRRILFAIVLLSWGYVIYATRLAALWQLQSKFPNQMLST